ncbi:MAG: hypothetical protein DI527_07480 [Chelatococcus sp.]|nr:MAG: hypothetical protein DI527_07480 [Chelatococcus sp.]
MKVVAALALLAPLIGSPASALDRCSAQEISQDRSNRRCDDLGFRRTVAAEPSGMPVTRWARAMQAHEALVVKAVQIGDLAELQRQAAELRARSNDPTTWPDDDKWTVARIYCATTAQELANFVDDKLKRTARGEIAAEASLKAYREAGVKCRRGIAKLK